MRLWDHHWSIERQTVKWEFWPGRAKNYERLGPDILGRYTEDSFNREADVVYVERSFSVDIEGFPVRGIIDQVRRMGNDLLVLDFKTSKEPPDPLVLRTDPQLTIYAHATFQEYKTWPRVGQYHLRSGKFYESERVKDQDILDVLAMINEGSTRIQKNLLTRQLGYHCGRCPFKVPCLTEISR